VPHIYATDAQGLFYGFGWAQMRNHGDLLLRLYCQARGRAAEYFGSDYLISDRAVRTMGLHRRGDEWYAAQSPDFRGYLDAFAAGINAYASAHLDQLAEAGRAVLPVTAADVLAHGARVLYVFLGSIAGVLQALPGGSARGSNGWAVAPSHTVGGHSLLLANPHTYWGEEQTWFEAHLSAPGVYHAYGATFVGFPVLGIALNDYLGWTHTDNAIDAADLYALTTDGDGYRFDGETRAFETHTETIKARQDDGTLREETLTVRRSVQGPVVEAGGPVAIRMTAVDDWSSAAGALEQWWDMGRATNLEEFEAVLKRLQIPLFTVIYADRDGHVLSLFNGQVPVRPQPDRDWTGLIPGDTSATLWTAIHSYEDLPKVIDPPEGWVQNSNSPPWFTTYPPVLDPDRFPPYMAPQFLNWRERRGIRMLQEHPRLSLEQLIQLKHSTRMELADRVLDELVAAARQSEDATAREAAEVLATWDRQAKPDSTGALLFYFWVGALPTSDSATLSDLFAIPWDPSDPLDTPKGLRDTAGALGALAAAAKGLKFIFDRLDVPFGDVARLQLGEFDLPANGFPGDPFGVFRALYFDTSTISTEKQTRAVGGDSFIAAVEFGDPVKAMVLNSAGNASQTGSRHIGDQLALAAKGQLRDAWLTRDEVLAHLEEREVVGRGTIATPEA
jgi:acyl-homoserine-lactone acylase